MPPKTTLETAIKPPERPITCRKELLSKLRGQTAHIPRLEPIFAGRLKSLGFSKRKQESLEATDCALFVALWWPEASLESLETLAYLVIWLFTWDDEIDEPTGTYSEDLSAAQVYREYTLRFVGECLGILPVGQQARFECCRHNIVQSFDVIGAALRNFYDKSQCQRFYDEIVRFIAASEQEQLGRLQGHVFSLSEYWNFRLGSSAVYIGTAAGEYSIFSRIPAEIMCSLPMKSVWYETNVIISITNDLISLRKEIKLGCIDSIVPLTFASTHNVQQAIAESVKALRCSRKRFDMAAQRLLAQHYQDDETRCQVRKFIEVQRSNCVGNLVWRYDFEKLLLRLWG